MSVDEQVSILRQMLWAGYEHYFATSDGHSKSADGMVTVRWPAYWESRERPDPAFEVYSYVLGPSRSHFFRTYKEAFAAVWEWVTDELTRERTGWDTW